MKKNKLLFLLLLFISSTIIAQKKAFVIFDSEGNKTTYQELFKQSKKAEADKLAAKELKEKINSDIHFLQ